MFSVTRWKRPRLFLPRLSSESPRQEAVLLDALRSYLERSTVIYYDIHYDSLAPFSPKKKKTKQNKKQNKNKSNEKTTARA